MGQTVGYLAGWRRLACAAKLHICTTPSAAGMFDTTTGLYTHINSHRGQQE